jgi:hypothetical protein
MSTYRDLIDDEHVRLPPPLDRSSVRMFDTLLLSWLSGSSNNLLHQHPLALVSQPYPSPGMKSSSREVGSGDTRGSGESSSGVPKRKLGDDLSKEEGLAGAS